MRSNTTYYIFSVERSNLSLDVNDKRTAMVKKELVELGYKPVSGSGCFQGCRELSFLVEGSNSDENIILNLAKRYNQECIMRVYDDNAAELIYDRNTRKVIGKLELVKEVSPEMDYSLFNDKYFVVKGIYA